MKIVIINGPNLNLLGKRETDIYGSLSFEQYLQELRVLFPSVTFDYFQSNIEGELVDRLQEVGYGCDGIVLNPAAYTHTSVAIGDAVAAIKAPVVEVHISNIHARESFRHHSYTAMAAFASLCGFGIDGYRLAISGLAAKLGAKAKP